MFRPRRSSVAFFVLVLTFALLLPAIVRADEFGDKFFTLLKQYHPEPDQVEFARYYVYEPDHANVIYEKVSGQDYAFIAILAAAKAAKNQEVTPKNARFTYDTCMIPINTFNSVFAKSGDYIDKYGQEEHVKGYLNEQNQKGKEEASAKMAEYIPYWNQIPDICHFTFFTNFDQEKEIKKNLGDGFKTIKLAFSDFASGDVASGIDKLSSSGIAGNFVCEFADKAIYGGAVGKVPVLGKAAKGVCASFAGSIIKGIGTATGAVVNATGEFIGDFACAALIGSCTKVQSVDGFFNPSYETFIDNWTFSPPAQAEAWADNWYNTIRKNNCTNIGGSESGTKCTEGWNQLTASARTQAKKLRDEPKLAYEQIYKPKLNQLVTSNMALSTAMLLSLDATCAENLLTKYPWPGPQLTDHHNKVFRDLCGQARSRSDFGGGRSFNTQLSDKTIALNAKLDAACPTQSAKGRVCNSYPTLATCVSSYAAYGIERGEARTKFCTLNREPALAEVAKQIDTKSECTATKKTALGVATLAVSCPTYGEKHRCITAVNAINGVDSNLFTICRADKIAANKEAGQRIVQQLNANVSPASRNARSETCTFADPAINCSSIPQKRSCDQILNSQSEIPSGALRCAYLQPVATTRLPDERRTPPVTSLPRGGQPAPPPTVSPEAAAAVVSRDLQRKGCKFFLGRAGDWLCSSDAGFKACEDYKKKGSVANCRRARTP